jgi:hypothetical protein
VTESASADPTHPRRLSDLPTAVPHPQATREFLGPTPSKTLIRLSMSYQAEGLVEALGSAAGLDERRVRGDLERLKELIETRGAESGAWRGEVSARSKE